MFCYNIQTDKNNEDTSSKSMAERQFVRISLKSIIGVVTKKSGDNDGYYGNLKGGDCNG